MPLPFFDKTSSARYIADLLDDAEPRFQSLAIAGMHTNELSIELQNDAPYLQIVTGEAKADVVVSFDEVHLLKPNERADYVASIAQIASREAIIACPLGTDLQISIYRSLLNLAKEQKQSPPTEISLALECGLPTPQTAASWAHGFSDLDLFYAGDVAFFQEQATHYLWQSRLSPMRRRLLKLTSANMKLAEELPLPPETVPMRRHRRLYLILRKR